MALLVEEKSLRRGHFLLPLLVFVGGGWVVPCCTLFPSWICADLTLRRSAALLARRKAGFVEMMCHSPGFVDYTVYPFVEKQEHCQKDDF